MEASNPNFTWDNPGFDNIQNEKDVLLVYDKFYDHYLSICSELASKEESLKMVTAQKNNLLETNNNLKDEYLTMQTTVTECQTQLQLVCNLHDEIRLLKKDVVDKEEALQVETKHWNKSIQDLQKDMASKLEDQKLTLTNSNQIQVDKLSETISILEEKIVKLEHQLQALEKEKSAEINSLIMNYESKLNKANRQNAQYKNHQQLVVTNDVLRKKMQHLKANYDSEVSFLKSKIADLEQGNERLRQQVEKQTCALNSNSSSRPSWQAKRASGNRLKDNWSSSLNK